MVYTHILNGPKGYGFTPWSLPTHLQYRPYRVVSHNFEPDGGIYTVGEKFPNLYDIPYTEIPTGKHTWVLEFGNSPKD